MAAPAPHMTDLDPAARITTELEEAPSGEERDALAATLLAHFQDAHNDNLPTNEQLVQGLFQLLRRAIQPSEGDRPPLRLLLQLLTAYAAEGDAARIHVVARLRGLLSVLRCRDATDEDRALAVDLLLALIDDKAADGAMAAREVDFVDSFLALLETTQSDDRVVSHLTRLMLALWHVHASVGGRLVRRLTCWCQLATLRHKRVAVRVLSNWVAETPHPTDAVMGAACDAGVVRGCVSVLFAVTKVYWREGTCHGDPGDDQILEHAVAIMDWIAQANRTQDLLQGDALDALTAVLVRKPSTALLRSRTSTVLAKLCDLYATAQLTIGANTDCLDVFLDMLRDGTTVEKIAAARALEAVCRESNQHVEKLPLGDVLDECAQMLNQVEGHSDEAVAALRLIASVALEPAAWTLCGDHPTIIKHVLRLLQCGRGDTQMEACYASVSMLSDPCRQQLIDGNVERLLDAIEDVHVRPTAQLCLRQWRMVVHTLEADRTINNISREVDGFCIVEADECLENETNPLGKEIGALTWRFMDASLNDVAAALIAAADEIADRHLTAADLVRFGVGDVVFHVLEPALLASGFTTTTTVCRLDEAAANALTATGLEEIFRSRLALIKLSDFAHPQAAIEDLVVLANAPRLGALLLQAGAVDVVKDILFDKSPSPPLQQACVKFLISIASSPAPALVLEHGAVDLLLCFYDMVVQGAIKIEEANRKDLLSVLMDLARHLRAVLVLLLASPHCSALQAELFLLESDRPGLTNPETGEHCVTFSGSSVVVSEEKLQGDAVSQSRELRAIVRLLEDPVERAQLLDAGLVDKLCLVSASSDQSVCAWARAALFLLHSSSENTVEFAVMTYLHGDDEQKLGVLQQLLTTTEISYTEAEIANVFALGVAALQSNNEEAEMLGRQLLLRLHDRGTLSAHVARLEQSQCDLLAHLLYNAMESKELGQQGEIIKLLGVFAEIHADSKQLASQKLLELVDVVRNVSSCSDETRLTAASMVVILLDGRLKQRIHGEQRVLVVAMYGGLLQAFMALFTTAGSSEVASTAVTRLSRKLIAMENAKIDMSKPARVCLVALLRAMFSLAKTTNSERATFAIELLIQWAKESPNEFVEPLVDAGAWGIVTTVLSLEGDVEKVALGSVRLSHALELVCVIATAEDQLRVLTQHAARVLEGLKRLQASKVTTAEDTHGVIEQAVEGLYM